MQLLIIIKQYLCKQFPKTNKAIHKEMNSLEFNEDHQKVFKKHSRN